MILIVGATGSLGGGLAKALLQRGVRLRAVVRPELPLRTVGRHTDPALGAAVDTVPEPLATSITQLLGMMADQPARTVGGVITVPSRALTYLSAHATE